MLNMTALKMLLKQAEKRKINAPKIYSLKNELLKLGETRPV